MTIKDYMDAVIGECFDKIIDALPVDRREQAISFTYGNMKMHNPNLTREIVAAQYDKLHPSAPVEQPQKEETK